MKNENFFLFLFLIFFFGKFLQAYYIKKHNWEEWVKKIFLFYCVLHVCVCESVCVYVIYEFLCVCVCAIFFSSIFFFCWFDDFAAAANQ